MRTLVVILFCIIFFVVAAAPVAPGFFIRNEIAFHALKLGNEDLAERLYEYGSGQGDPLSQNNLLVLQYRSMRNDNSLTGDAWNQAVTDTREKFKSLGERGVKASIYNLGMFNFRCSPNARCYNYAKLQFIRASKAGDKLARAAYALHLSSLTAHPDSELRLKLLRNAADEGFGWPAYEYARHVSHQSLEEAREYYLIAARAGYADAQSEIGLRYDDDEKVYWLKKAALNKNNRSIYAAISLAELYAQPEDGAEPNYMSARKWYKLAATPREPFFEKLDIRRDGLRWRSLQTYRSAEINGQNKAAYEYALLLLKGLGGEKDENHAVILLADAKLVNWEDSALILAQLNVERSPSHTRSLQQERLINENLAYYSHKGGAKRFPELLPFIEEGRLRYATALDLYRWQDKWEQKNQETNADAPKTATSANKWRYCSPGKNCFVVIGNEPLSAEIADNPSISVFTDQGEIISARQ